MDRNPFEAPKIADKPKLSRYAVRWWVILLVLGFLVLPALGDLLWMFLQWLR
jgi:hypothetical protein